MQGIHHFHHGFVFDGFVGGNHDGRRWHPGLRFLDARDQGSQWKSGLFLAIDTQAQGFVAGHDDFHHFVWPLFAGADAGQIHEARGDEGGADHENDEQHQHHVNERHHVDLTDGAAACTATGYRGHRQWPPALPAL